MIGRSDFRFLGYRILSNFAFVSSGVGLWIRGLEFGCWAQHFGLSSFIIAFRMGISGFVEVGDLNIGCWVWAGGF